MRRIKDLLLGSLKALSLESYRVYSERWNKVVARKTSQDRAKEEEKVTLKEKRLNREIDEEAAQEEDASIKRAKNDS